MRQISMRGPTSPPPDPAPARYCRACGYNLHAHSARPTPTQDSPLKAQDSPLPPLPPRCPECGRPFDPANPRTYRSHPRRRWFRRLVQITTPPLLLALATAALANWLYRDWKLERQHDSIGGPWIIDSRPLGGEYLLRQLGSYGQYLNRARSVQTCDDLIPGDMATLADFHYLQELYVRAGMHGMTDSEFASLAGLTDLTTLLVSDTQITDAGLLHLRNLHQLQTLNLHGYFTGSALAQLDLQSLRELSLESTLLNDSALPPLASASRLQSLTLSYGPITDAGLLHLRTLHQLQTLHVSSGKFTGSALVELDLHNLRELSLFGDRINDSAIPALAAAPHLQSLTLHSDALTDAGLAHLRTLHQLQTLVLDSPLITGSALADLDLHDLRTTSLRGELISDSALHALAACPHLEEIRLFTPRITDAGLRELKSLKTLRRLELHEADVTVQGWEELRAALPALEIR